MKALIPVNQKTVYHSAGDLYEKIMNEKIPSQNKAQDALKALSIMNKAYGFELKRWELEQAVANSGIKTELRTIEVKGFDNIPIEDNTD